MESDQASRIWAWEEYGHLEVGDARLRDRAVLMASRLPGSAAGRVSEAFRDAAERQGAYDLLEGGRVSAEALLRAASKATIERGDGEDFVYVPIDATSIHIVDRKRKTDLGLVGTYTNNARGLNVVTALSVSASGTPLGICAQKWWVRPPQRRKRSRSKYQPVDKRESRFMVQAIEEVAAAYAGSGTRPWAVVDRGGDATVVLDEMLRQQVLFTVRASWNRRILRNDAIGKVRDWMRSTKVQQRNELSVPEGHNRPARLAKLDVRVGRVELDVRHDWQAKRSNPTVNVVWVLEPRPPRGQKALDWMLYTNAPIDTPEQIAAVIKSYAMRWRIEDFHKTWKSGHCGVEDTQLRSAAAAKAWATLLATVAARVERLKHLARNEPEKPASIELSPIEIKALKLLKGRFKSRVEVIPAGMPSIAQAVRWLADLGGYQNPKQGPPGAIVIGRGLEMLAPGVLMLEALAETRKMR
jgi:Transposase DNA-binding/Transposase DDE domain